MNKKWSSPRLAHPKMDCSVGNALHDRISPCSDRLGQKVAWKAWDIYFMPVTSKKHKQQHLIILQ